MKKAATKSLASEPCLRVQLERTLHCSLKLLALAALCASSSLSVGCSSASMEEPGAQAPAAESADSGTKAAASSPPSAADNPNLGQRAANAGGAGVPGVATGGTGDMPAAGRAGSAAIAAAGSGGRESPAGAGATSAAGSGGAAGQPAAGAAAAGAAGAAAVECPSDALEPGDTTATLEVGGTTRTFSLHVPTGYTGKSAVPLVLDWHGLGSSGTAQRRLSGYAALSDQEGFIVAWPNGLDNAWNIGPCCTTSRTVDDLGFARAVVDDIKRRACIDPKRVYADGYSMGGGMSYYLACNAADVFAAIAPSAFDLLAEDEQPCKPTRPISVISFRGTSDPIVPYSGGASSPPNGLNVTIHFRGAEATFEHWSTLNGCQGEPVETSSGCRTYSTCSEGSEVTLCTTQGGSHDPGDAKLGWEMMKRHPMP